MVSTTFIYALCEPGTRTVRYIGKANDPKQRLKRHLVNSAKRQNHLGAWLRSLGTAEPNLVILREVSSELWQEEETRYIKAARTLGMDLVNATDGGEGSRGRALSPETKTKIRVALQGKKLSLAHRNKLSTAHRGKLPSQATRDKMSASRKGEKNPRFGKAHSIESRTKMRNKHLGKILSSTTRARMRVGQQLRRKAEAAIGGFNA